MEEEGVNVLGGMRAEEVIMPKRRPNTREE